jgi:ADP-ribose pyrophosphatase YjhB (NUDIX family)
MNPDQTEKAPLRWDVDPATNRTNSSQLYCHLVDEIASIVSNAHVGDNPWTVARTIVSQLAHKHGLAPKGAVVCEPDCIECRRLGGQRAAAVSLVLDFGDGEEPTRVVCVWNKRYRGWTLPGGLVEDGETPAQAQARELEEEAGMRTENARLVFSGEHNIEAAQGAARPGRASLVYLYLVEAYGEPHEVEEGCPVDRKTVEEFLAVSPFAELYRKILPSIVEEAARAEHEATRHASHEVIR